MQLLARQRAAQIPFQPSASPARPSLYLPSTEHPYTRPIAARQTLRAISMTTHVHTSIGAAQKIPELHVGRRYAED